MWLLWAFSGASMYSKDADLRQVVELIVDTLGKIELKEFIEIMGYLAEMRDDVAFIEVTSTEEFEKYHNEKDETRH